MSSNIPFLFASTVGNAVPATLVTQTSSSDTITSHVDVSTLGLQSNVTTCSPTLETDVTCDIPTIAINNATMNEIPAPSAENTEDSCTVSFKRPRKKNDLYRQSNV